MRDAQILLAHGNGGRQMRELIEEVFVRHLANPELDQSADGAVLPAIAGDMVVSTDGFTVHPLEFPGGDIGSLAVNGTVNDLAVCGADPLYLTLSCFIEEGFAVSRLNQIAASIARAARKANVRIVTGDTKVLRRGEGGGLYLCTTGIGARPSGVFLGMQQIRAGDHVLVSGSVGDHGTAVLLARGEFGLGGSLASDCASVVPLCRALRQLPGVRFMRDPTRGGLATVAHEIARGTGLGLRLREADIRLRPEVQSVCEMLGYNPLYLACEGRIVAVVAPDAAGPALDALRQAGADAADIGTVMGVEPSVVLETELGGERLLEELESDPLPRIC